MKKKVSKNFFSSKHIFDYCQISTEAKVVRNPYSALFDYSKRRFRV